MNKKIIVLGMDNSGKTTLSKMLSEKLNYKIINSGGPKITKEEMEDRMLNNLSSEENIVFERFPFFEEWVYGRILRGQSKFQFTDPIYEQIKSYKPLIIYCRPSNEKIMEWKGREQMIGVIEESEALIREFDKTIFKIINDFNVGFWDYENDDFDELIEFISSES